MINPDGSFEQGWMNLGFDDGAWANLHGGRPASGRLRAYLGLDDTLGAKFMFTQRMGPGSISERRSP